MLNAQVKNSKMTNKAVSNSQPPDTKAAFRPEHLNTILPDKG